MSETTSVCVRYTYAEEWHVFQSNDLPGLYVANKDAKKSYEDVALAIEKLIFLDEGVRCTVKPEMSFNEFISCIKAGVYEKEKYGEQTLYMSDKRYLVYASA